MKSASPQLEEPRTEPLPPSPRAFDWEADEGLNALVPWLRDPQVRYLSLDVFGTILPRFCARPVDVFPHVGRLLRDRGLLVAAITPAEFAELREEAERLAREARGSESGGFEVTLEEIYQRLRSAGVMAGDDPNRWAAAELEAEKRFCFANPLVLDLIRHTLAAGQQVAFVSDTYLSRRQLAELLKHHGVPCEEARVFVSSEYRVGKAGGRLFKHVLEDLSLAPEQVVHAGDNYCSDVQGATAAGMRAAHYFEVDDHTGEVAALEAEAPGGRHELGALLALRSLAQRQCLKVGRDQSDFFRHGAFVLGPVLSAFVVWSARRFAVRGVRHVLALMREGTLLGEMLRDAADVVGVNLQVAPCYVSRQSTALPMIFKLDQKLLEGLWWRKEPPTLARLAAGFRLSADDVARIGLPLDEPLGDEEDRLRVIDAFLTAPLRQRVEYEASKARDRLFGYLQTLVPMDGGEPVGILDLGWNGTIQRNLQQVLELSGFDLPLTGCYLGLTGRHARHRLSGTDLSAFFGTAAESQDFLSAIVRSPEVLEQAVMGNVGSTLGYDVEHGPGGASVAPALGRFRCLPLEVRRRDALNAGVRAYHALALDAMSRDPESVGALAGVTPRTYSLILKRLIDRPTQAEAFDLGGLHHDDNFGSDSWREICDDYADRVLLEGGPAAAHADHKVYWPQATMARRGVDHTTSGAGEVFDGVGPRTPADADAAVRLRLFWSEDGTFPPEPGYTTFVHAGAGPVEVEAEVPSTAKWLRLDPGDGPGMLYVPTWVLRAGGRESADAGEEVDLLPHIYHAERIVRLDEAGRRWAAYHAGPSLHVVMPPTGAGARRRSSLMHLRVQVLPLGVAAAADGRGGRD